MYVLYCSQNNYHLQKWLVLTMVCILSLRDRISIAKSSLDNGALIKNDFIALPLNHSSLVGLGITETQPITLSQRNYS